MAHIINRRRALTVVAAVTAAVAFGGNYIRQLGHLGLDAAVWTSIRSVAANPGPMALWGLIVATGLVIGSIPAFLGLIIIMPVLGHATWHLYRKVMA